MIGAGGFIGSRLVTALEDAGHPVARFTREHPAVVDGRPAEGLRDAESVFFLATGLSPALAERRPELVSAEHSLFRRLMDAFADEGRRPVLVFASSGGTVYAPDARPPYPESAPTGATTAYGRAKLLLERELLGRADAVQPVVVRLSNVYGPGQRIARGYGVLPHWLEAVVSGAPVRIFGDSSVVRDYVHVDDVVGGFLAVQRHVANGLRDRLPSVVNIGSGVPTSLEELLDIVTVTVGRQITVSREEGRSCDRKGNWLDASLAWRALGWRAEIDLKDGVRQCWDATLTAHGDSGP
ncbi:UDP-glucose 4-epimerase [Planobispora rosea]|uniref:UDP-glucose 4-epimerase n=1 Tax=Planobispora rosea TaxID=35762 RepID=A0A8J3WE19_PLARO|nr:NAD-dependent epimerase/dehydratase family protein [Planobispora rosea]GGS81306.1 UDP-glucose 4-epimerase [Planobispora rosea]GIH85895.1 UDP-glucose 4-epimerase [Planobispora rosea]